ncbi:MAG: glycosyltransferase family 1 protein, partial [Sphingomonadales bacterium]
LCPRAASDPRARGAVRGVGAMGGPDRLFPRRANPPCRGAGAALGDGRAAGTPRSRGGLVRRAPAPSRRRCRRAALPEYARPGGAERHRRRLRNAARFADAILVNSQATARAVEPYLAAAGRRPALLVAPLGIEPRFAPAEAGVTAAPPYFLCLGTIEPRKNHLLLLQIWRAMAERSPGTIPKLILAGRRGWENENVVDLLDRCPALQTCVVEAGRVGDHELAALIAGARAVLMPSFAEGFGLPVAEALTARVPVIASDIAVLRETGGAVPDYLDPLDGPGWIRAVQDYARPDSPMRAAQMQRMAGWSAPNWDAHFAQVLPFLDAL